MNNSTVLISDIKARILYNSRGSQCVEIDVYSDESIGRTSSPAGASTGKYEAPSFLNNEIEQSLSEFHKYKDQLIGLDCTDSIAMTEKLHEIDGTENYKKIGGSFAYAISIASIDCAANSTKIPFYKILTGDSCRMPRPLGNVLGGGMHAGEGSTDIQEFLSYPKGASNIRECINANLLVHKNIKNLVSKSDSNFSGGKGDEGAWAPNLSNDEALNVVHEATTMASDTLGFEILFGLDVASSSLWKEKDQIYNYSREGKKRNSEDQISYMSELIDKYDLCYVEDPLHEEAFDDFADLMKKTNTLVVGDDLLVTNAKILQKSIEKHSCNAGILKVNQAGSLGDALDFAKIANDNNISIITSHRSGDTVDPHIAHIAIATNSVMIKSGVVGGERISKLNELLRIDELSFISEGTSMPLIEKI